MPAEAKGSVRWVEATKGKPGHYAVRISLTDGSRPWIHCDPSARSPVAEQSARHKGEAWTEKYRTQMNPKTGKPYCGADFGIVPRNAPPVAATTGDETVSQFATRWLTSRTGRVKSVRDNKGHLNEHILQVIGPYAMTGVTSKEIEDVVTALDRKVRDGELQLEDRQEHLGHVHQDVRRRDAREARGGASVPHQGPHDGVRGPDDDDADKLLQFLYPMSSPQFVDRQGRAPRMAQQRGDSGVPAASEMESSAPSSGPPWTLSTAS